MSILSGFKKVRRRIQLPDGYKLLSFWTSSQTVEMDDGTTLESNKAKWDDMSANIDMTIKKKADKTELDTHVNNNVIHFTKTERDKLSGIAVGANKYTHPSSAAGTKASGLYKIATDANGHVTGVTAVTKTDLTNLGLCGLKILHGTASVVISNVDNDYSFSVNFPSVFTSTPTIVLTPVHNSNVQFVIYKLKTVSASSFTGFIRSSGGGAHSINWIAIGS